MVRSWSDHYHLAQMFPKVIGRDIAASMVEEATRISRIERNNASVHHVKAISEFECLPAFDVFFSQITLQHNPPPIIYYILAKILESRSQGE